MSDEQKSSIQAICAESANVVAAELEQSYKGGGTSGDHPRMLLKVLVYGYLRNIYSSRKLEQALQENLHFGRFG